MMKSARMSSAALVLCGLLATLMIAGCASFLKTKDSEKMLQNQEYDNAVHIKELATPIPGVPSVAPSTAAAPALAPAPTTLPSPSLTPSLLPSPAPVEKKSKRKKKGEASSGVKTAAGPIGHEPDVENGDGFTGRRPDVDPFHVGETTTIELSYFGAVAGDLEMQVLPFVEVNGRKSYHLKAHADSTSVFAMFYAVDDTAETFLDYETLIPSSYKLTVKESRQLRDTREYFDWAKLKGFYWDKKITKEHGLQEKKIDWAILPFSQNLISAPYYMRMFKLETGKSYKYRVAYEGKNMVVTAEVVRREVIDTEIGPMKAIVVKPTFQIDGAFSPTGEIYFWLSDDDRKFFLRIESKIKIGKIVGQIKKIDKGAP